MLEFRRRPSHITRLPPPATARTSESLVAIMIPVRIHTLIVTSAHAASVVVLQPIEERKGQNSTRIIPIWIGSNEATQLGVALEHTKFTRPMTHDLFIDALTNLDARVDRVEITDMKNGTFFSRLVLSQQGRIVSLDARPSDALALAVREDAPLFVEESVLEKASFPYLVKNAAEDGQGELDDFKTFLEELSPDDFLMYEEGADAKKDRNEDEGIQ